MSPKPIPAQTGARPPGHELLAQVRFAAGRRDRERQTDRLTARLKVIEGLVDRAANEIAKLSEERVEVVAELKQLRGGAIR